MLRSATLLLLAAFALAPLAGDSLAPLLPPRLTGFDNQPRSDGKGGSWDFNNGSHFDEQQSLYARFGYLSSGPNTGGMNGQVQQTADGSELVVTGQLNAGGQNLTVARRIRFDAKLGLVRLIEIVDNPGRSQAQVQLSVGYNSYYGGGAMPLTGELGGAIGNALGPKEGGLIVGVNPNMHGNQGRELVWWLADPRSPNKPAIQQGGRHGNGMSVTWALTIPAGRSAAVMHLMALRQPGANDAKTLQQLFAAGRVRAVIADLPPALRAIIVNHRFGGGGGDEALPLAIPDELLSARGEDADLVALGANTRLRGEAAAGDLALRLEGGRTLRIPWRDLLALRGGDGLTRVFLHDGQAIDGELSGGTLSFTLLTGQAITLPLAKAGWVVRRPQPPAANDGVLAELIDGQRLAGPVGAHRLRAATAWGPIDVPLAEVAMLRPAEGGGHTVELVDGTRVHVFLTAGELPIEHRQLGRIALPWWKVASLRAFGAAKPAADSDADSGERSAPHVTLAGGQVITGRIESAELRVVLSGNVITMPPEQIRRLVNVDLEGGEVTARPRLRLELWSGDTIEGALAEGMLTVRGSGGVFAIPLGEVQEAVVPTPTIPAATRTRIADLITDLGHADWTRRESAMQSLQRMGAIVRQPVEDAARVATDPEVKHRLDQVLQQIR